MAKSTKKDKTVISLFSGCGGMDLGLEGGFNVLRSSVNSKLYPSWIERKLDEKWVKLTPTSFRTIFANDINKFAKSCWTHNFSKLGISNPEDIYHLESIVEIVKESVNGKNSIIPNYADVVTGGFPCQDFSIAGKRKGFLSHKSHRGDFMREEENPNSENRGMLYMWMRELINIVRPKVFIAENVKGMVSLPNVASIIENDFKNIGREGYIVLPARVLKAYEYGVPQMRERIFFIGFNKTYLKPKVIRALQSATIPHDYAPYPKQTHFYKNGELFSGERSAIAESNCLLPSVTVGNALIDLGEPSEANDITHRHYSKARWYGEHCQGHTEVELNGIGPTIRAEHHGNIEFRRLTVEHGGKYKHELKKGYEERRLSVRECARLQTFPDTFDFVIKSNNGKSKYSVSPSEAYRLIGNAVPPLLAYHIAKRLEEVWDTLFDEQ